MMRINLKIDVSEIIKNHFKSLVNANKNRPDFWDIIIFYILPIMVSGGLIYFNILIGSKLINTILSGLAIFIGLLINVLILIFDLVNRGKLTKNKNELLNDLVANISFSVLISIITILLLLLSLSNIKWLTLTSLTAAYIILVHFVVVLLMILKRIYNLFSHELEENKKNSQ